jgi:hypothetical protein
VKPLSEPQVNVDQASQSEPGKCHTEVKRPDFLKEHITDSILELDKARRDALYMYLVSEFDADNGTEDKPAIIRFGTVCSGSELYLSVFRIYEAVFLDVYKLHIRFYQEFLCEIVQEKADFSLSNNILEQTKPPIAFCDIHDMCTNPHRAKTHIGELVAVPSQLDFILAGTSCVDASRASKNHFNVGVDSVENQSGHTGTTFSSLVALQNIVGAKRIYQEIVLSVTDTSRHTGKSNYDAMKCMWAMSGHSFFGTNMSAHTGGIRTRRPRLYMLAKPGAGDEDKCAGPPRVTSSLSPELVPECFPYSCLQLRVLVG